MIESRPTKPLGIRAYGHVPHLPGSRMGPGDHHCHEGQARICTERARDRHDVIIVQEKLDGSCMAVAKLDGQILPLQRRGYLATSSPYRQHHLFAEWVYANYDRFDALLQEGERVVGEWLALAHGTRYDLTGREPFVAFDLMRGDQRATVAELNERAGGVLMVPQTVSIGPPLSIEAAMKAVERSGHGALDPVEGAVWRVERNGRVEFLAKYVRPDKVDGCLLSDVSGGAEIWNWLPEGVTG
jgi:hypothetical protein